MAHHHHEPIPSHHGAGHVHHHKHTDHPHGFHHIKHRRGHQVVVGACKLSKHHDADTHYTAHAAAPAAAGGAFAGLPPVVDLRAYLTPVEDQGALGSCTANAIAGAYEYMQKRITGRDGDVSRLFLYYVERKQEGTVDKDCGAALRDGIQALQTIGICSESTWPYQIDEFTIEPPHTAYHEAARHRIEQSFKIPVDAAAMMHCLAQGYPIAFGAQIFESFEAHGTHGRIALPEAGEKCLGGHAMLLVGYSIPQQIFCVRNSWGPDWGDQGYCYFPLSYLTNPAYMHDCWTLRVTHDLDFGQDIHGGGRQGSAEDWHKQRAR